MSDDRATTVSVREYLEALLRERDRAVEIAKDAMRDGLMVRITEMGVRVEEARKKIDDLEVWRGRVLGASASVSAAIGVVIGIINLLLSLYLKQQ